jgi:SAM-dependent methyltransferase
MSADDPRFADHFSVVSEVYARFRPRYPEALFYWLAEVAPGRRLAWDCATGNGQAAIGLAGHFARVVATDASAAQIEVATPSPRIEYRIAPAEASGLPEQSCDLVAVAQALHWFDRPAFFAEARRVLVPGGVLAIWGYLRLRTGEVALDRELDRFHEEVVGPYWPPGRELIENGYRDVDFPFEALVAPPFAIAASLSLDALAGYFDSWSATDRYRRAVGSDPVPEFVAGLASAWGAERPVRWPIALRAGRVPATAIPEHSR